MRNIFIYAELHHLRVYHNELNKLRRRVINYRTYQCINCNGFTASRCSRHQKVRHGSKVTHICLPPRNILTHSKRECRLAISKLFRLHQLTEEYHSSALIRQLDPPHDAFTRNRGGNYPDTHGRHGKCQIV